MNKILRLLQPLLIVFLLVSVCALIFVAYTQHEGQQRWINKYEDAIHIQQNYKQLGLPVTLKLSRFGNATDLDKTEFTDDLHHRVEPLTITLYSNWDIVTFWFAEQSVSNRQLLLHLPSWGQNDYVPISIPFFDYQQTLGN